MTIPLLHTSLETGTEKYVLFLTCAQFYEDDAFTTTLLGCLSRI